MDDRIRARRRAVARARVRRRRQVVGSFAALALVAVAAFVVARSPVFVIAEVQVVGVAGPDIDAVREAAGLRAGENLLFADLEGATARVVGLPWVRDAHIRRRPPSTVEVHVSRREPVAVVQLPGESWLVDDEGVVVAGGTADGLAQIVAPSAVLPPVGGRVRDAVLTSALQVRAQLPGGFRALVVRYEALRERDLRLHLADGVVVRFGDAERVEAKARSVTLILEQLQRQQGRPGAGHDPDEEVETGGSEAATIIDVRAPDNPVLVPGQT